ncbi:MAG: CinA family protein [Candidatus Omnitrophica bacterium]|nr:CinA family protein [Candidatus Omnitrophota bacterium]MDD5352820.1 CinA family protein [Candidatus Omnitrophota bacterium]MDD5550419.1 CinA family protein [Candidatus Omnitrophota bacterium]
MLLKKVAELLLKKKLTIAVAESCTGGLTSHSLTNINGSSKYFKLGLVLYSNQAKSGILKIKTSEIKKHGAVSERIAFLMAKKVRELAKTDIGISSTGIAGPSGGSRKKPVGTVFIGIACKNCVVVRKFNFKGTRLQIKNKTKNKTLLLIKTCLANQ